MTDKYDIELLGQKINYPNNIFSVCFSAIVGGTIIGSLCVFTKFANNLPEKTSVQEKLLGIKENVQKVKQNNRNLAIRQLRLDERDRLLTLQKTKNQVYVIPTANTEEWKIYYNCFKNDKMKNLSRSEKMLECSKKAKEIGPPLEAFYLKELIKESLD